METNEDFSLKMKIILTCGLIVLAVFTLTMATNSIDKSAPYIQSGGFEEVSSGNANMTFNGIEMAFAFVGSREDVVNMTLDSLEQTVYCDGMKYGIYLIEKKIRYEICQNGFYRILKQKPMGMEVVKGAMDTMWQHFEDKSRKFITQ